MSNFSKLLTTIIIFMVIFFGSALMGTAGHMIKAGRLSKKALAVGVVIFALILITLIVSSVSLLIMRHSYELKKPKAGEILSDIIRIGELGKQREAEKAAAAENGEAPANAANILHEMPKSGHGVS